MGHSPNCHFGSGGSPKSGVILGTDVDHASLDRYDTIPQLSGPKEPKRAPEEGAEIGLQ